MLQNILRQRVQVGTLLTNSKQDRLLRAKASFESEAETLRARAAELMSANTSIEREMRNGQQDVLSR